MRFLTLTLACVVCAASTVYADGAAANQGGKKVRTPASRRVKKSSRKSQPPPAATQAAEPRGYLADEEARRREEFQENFYAGVLRENNVGTTTPELLQALEGEHPVVKIAAAHFLGKRGERTALPPLRRLLADKDSAVKIKAAEVLARLGDTSGFGTLLQESASPDRGNRLNAVSVSIGFANTDKKPEVTGLLTRALRDSDKNVRAAAAAGLGTVGGPAAVAALRQARESETDEIVKLVLDQQLRKLGQ